MAWCDHGQPLRECEKCAPRRVHETRLRRAEQISKNIARNSVLRKRAEEQRRIRQAEWERQVAVYPPVVFHTTGIGRKFHRTADCEALIEGWDRVENPTELVSTSTRRALESGFTHCRTCLPRSIYVY